MGRTPQETKIDLHRRELDQVRREKLMEEAMKEEYRMRAEEAEQHLQEVIQKVSQARQTLSLIHI